ncbi:hypothetical protein [Bilophila wadsworthia]|uniref:hypothetical protein n=1 Tax=Bilophila wadsworthia TaxID=35833 RepID=UPI00267511ED|nr:hypothetical protein [Bilophila wadsworthia]
MTKRVMLFCALCLLLAFTLKPEALAGFGNVEWGASPQEVQKQFGIKELNKSPLLTEDKYFIWGEEWNIGAFTDETGFCSVILMKMDDNRDKMFDLTEKLYKNIKKKYGSGENQVSDMNVIGTYRIKEEWITPESIIFMNAFGAEPSKKNKEKGGGVLTIRIDSRLAIDADKF